MPVTAYWVAWMIAVGPLGHLKAAEPQPPAVQVVKNHQSRWQIHSPSEGKPGVDWAIGELQKYIALMSDAKLPGDKRPGDGPAIVVGLRADLSPQHRALLPPPAIGHDGYAVAVHNGADPAVLVAGDNGRGTVYGVYDLLERLGCRWFYPTQDPRDPEVVPRTASLSLPAGAWAVASPMKYRIYNGDAWYFDMDYKTAAKQVDHAMKLRCNMIGWQCAVDKPLLDQYRVLGERGVLKEIQRRGMGLHGPAHSFNLFLPNALFGEHPDWFGMREGRRVRQEFAGAQFCWSNAEARKVFAGNVAEFARQADLLHMLAIVPFDGGKACDCPQCRKTGASNCLMAVMNEVIEHLHSVRPDLPIETVGGYAPVIAPPTTARIHPRQRVAWAHWGRYMAAGYDDPRYDHKKNLEAWQKAAPGGVTVVQYYSDNFAEPWIMPPFAQAIQGDRRYLLGRKIDSIYFLIYPSGYWWNHGLNTYLSARCFYDASLDPFAVVQDYATHYYGPAASPLLARYFDQWAKDPDLAYHLRGAITRQDRETLARQRRELIDPAIKASKGDSVYSYRVGKIAALHGLAERMAEGWHLRHRIQLARSRGDFQQAGKLLEEARALTEAIMGRFEDLAARDQGLIDKNEVRGFIKIGIKGWIDTEAKAIAAQDKRINEAEVRQDMK